MISITRLLRDGVPAPRLVDRDARALRDARTLLRRMERMDWGQISLVDWNGTWTSAPRAAQPSERIACDRLPEAEAYSLSAANAVRGAIAAAWPQFEVLEAHTRFYGPIRAAADAVFAVGARHHLDRVDYALLTAPWRDAFGPLPGESDFERWS